MDLARLRFGDWVMGLGGVAVLVVMLLDWYELPGGETVSAWEAFSVNDVILALAAVMALTSFVLTALQPTAAIPLALASLTTLVAIVALLLVVIRVISPPDVNDLETARQAGAWLGLVATALLTGGCLASIRDERVPLPERPVEPRLVRQ